VTKRRTATVSLGIVVWCVWMTCVAPMASAKGPSQGVITGPSLPNPITLREPGSPSIGPELANVVTQSGFFVGVWGANDSHGSLAHRPAGNLGPRYTITYTMAIPERPTSDIVQYVFPYAEPQPITYIPPNQTYWGRSKTLGGWYAAPLEFRRTLIGLGLPASVLTPMPSPTGTDVGDTAEAGAGGSSRLALWITGSLLAVVLLAVLPLAAVLTRSRRSRRAATAH
jgi:hypothetical protein